jgi:hypothetical protein
VIRVDAVPPEVVVTVGEGITARRIAVTPAAARRLADFLISRAKSVAPASDARHFVADLCDVRWDGELRRVVVEIGWREESYGAYLTQEQAIDVCDRVAQLLGRFGLQDTSPADQSGARARDGRLLSDDAAERSARKS